MSDEPNPATVEAMCAERWPDPWKPPHILRAEDAARVADRLVAAAREEERERYAPLVEAAKDHLAASMNERIRAALADLGEGQ